MERVSERDRDRIESAATFELAARREIRRSSAHVGSGCCAFNVRVTNDNNDVIGVAPRYTPYM